MPLYEYYCDKDDSVFEALKSFSASDKPAKCPKCGRRRRPHHADDLPVDGPPQGTDENASPSTRSKYATKNPRRRSRA